MNNRFKKKLLILKKILNNNNQFLKIPNGVNKKIKIQKRYLIMYIILNLISFSLALPEC